MTLDEFIAEERKRLDTFVEMWLDCAHQSPEQFPMKMPPGEWDEQLRIFNEE